MSYIQINREKNILKSITKGYISPNGLIPAYKDADEITISPGIFDLDGVIFENTAEVSVTLITPSSYLLSYIYARRVGSGFEFASATNAPTYDSNRKGWYYQNWRQIAWGFSPNGVSSLAPFTVVEISQNHIRYVFERLSLALNMDPDGAWQEPNTSNISSLSPVSAKEARVSIVNYRGLDTWAAPGWVNTEDSAWAPVPSVSAISSWSVGMHATTFIPSVTEIASKRRWGALGASRNIKIGDDNTNLNYLTASLEGIGFGR